MATVICIQQDPSLNWSSFEIMDTASSPNAMTLGPQLVACYSMYCSKHIGC